MNGGGCCGLVVEEGMDEVVSKGTAVEERWRSGERRRGVECCGRRLAAAVGRERSVVEKRGAWDKKMQREKKDKTG